MNAGDLSDDWDAVDKSRFAQLLLRLVELARQANEHSNVGQLELGLLAGRDARANASAMRGSADVTRRQIAVQQALISVYEDMAAIFDKYAEPGMHDSDSG